MGTNGRARGAAGLTMVELLIAASIVAVSLLAIAAIFPVALSNIDTGAEQTVAATVGQAFTEMVRNTRWTTLLAYNGFDSNDPTTCPRPPAHPVQANADCLRWIDQITGNTAVNLPSVKGPGALGLDMALTKRLRLTEKTMFTLRADAINILNKPQWGLPNTNVNSTTFGRITNATGSRTVLVGARVDF